jgi:hypothetical protein
VVAAARTGRRGKSGLHWATMPDNVRAGRLDGKCHRKDTAVKTATVKWCVKSAPAVWRHIGLVNPIGSKVRQEGLTRPADPPG